MKLPDWATHLAVDPDGAVCAFDAPPVWTEHGDHAVWLPASNRRCAPILNLAGGVGVPLARLLCVVLTNPHNAPETPVNAPLTHEAPP